MSPKPVVPFRQRLLEDMAIRHFSEKSTHDYVRHIDRFLAFLGRPPETATADDLRDFQVHLNQGACVPPPLTARFRPCAFSFARRSASQDWVINWPACITRASCRACFPLKR